MSVTRKERWYQYGRVYPSQIGEFGCSDAASISPFLLEGWNQLLVATPRRVVAPYVRGHSITGQSTDGSRGKRENVEPGEPYSWCVIPYAGPRRPQTYVEITESKA